MRIVYERAVRSSWGASLESKVSGLWVLEFSDRRCVDALEGCLRLLRIHQKTVPMEVAMH